MMKKLPSALLRFSICCSLFLLAAATAANAQAGRGSINGTITDPSGAIVPGASITLTNHATGLTEHAVATAAGLYTFVSLNPGQYQVTASHRGFETTAQNNITVSVDQMTVVNIALTIGAASEVVNVNAAVDLVEPSNSTVGQLITAETIDRVPLLTRNVFDLVQLSPGVTPANGAPNSSSSFAIENISSGRPGVDVSSYTINGAIAGSVYYMVDGSPIGIAENNAAAIIPALDIPEDGVEETRVETQNTPASYQSGGAGVISLVTKSGTNKFHGDAFGVFRPDILAANEYFNKQSQVVAGTPNMSPSFHRYQEGGAFGGPILHNKLFVFLPIMRQRNRSLSTAQTTSPFQPLPSATAISRPTTSLSTTQRNPISPPAPLPVHASPSPATRSPIPIPSRSSFFPKCLPATSATCPAFHAISSPTMLHTTTSSRASIPQLDSDSTSAWTGPRVKSSASSAASPLTGSSTPPSTHSGICGI
ncbi:MAG: carboxypeptidase regulatory-like domain-containing protein [Terracidiphilus sp.]